MYNKKLEEANEDVMELENELRDAVSNNEIEVHFQPKVNNKVDQGTAPVILPPLTSPDRPGWEGRKAGTA